MQPTQIRSAKLAEVVKGKAHRSYEFGVKASALTTPHRSRGGQFVAHVAALPGNPYDFHTLATVYLRHNHLANSAGHAGNAMLAAIGNNFHLLNRWPRFLLRRLIRVSRRALSSIPPKIRGFHGRLAT